MSNIWTKKYIRVLIPSILIVLWFAIGGIGGPYFGKISDVATNDQSTFLPANAESTKANEKITNFQDEKSIPAIIIFTDKDKVLSDEAIAKIDGAATQLKTIPGVSDKLSPPLRSEDGKAALVVANVVSGSDYKEVAGDIKSSLSNANLPLEHKVTGPIGFLYDLSGAFAGIDGILLGVALAVVFVILLFVYRSPVLPFLVLINSMFALCASILLVYYLAKWGVITLNGQVQGILFILVIGAATDYALLFVSRYREELARQKEAYRAILTSWKRSFEPIVAAGGTVVAGLLCLLLSDLNSNKALGPVGGIGIVMAIIATLTFLPSLLLVWGRKVFWPRIPHVESEQTYTSREGIWPAIARFVARRARPIWITTTIVMLAMTFGLAQIRADGVPQSDLILGSSEARDGQTELNQHFPGGSGTPVQIITSERALATAIEKLDSDKGIASVSAIADNSPSGTIPLGKEQLRIQNEIRADVEKSLTDRKAAIRAEVEKQMTGAPPFAIDAVYEQVIGNIPSVDSVIADIYPFKDVTTKVVDGEVLLQATLVDDADSDAAQATIERLRSILHRIDPTSLVGGNSAVLLDTRTSSERDREVVIPAVLIVITIILMLLLRSILAPILLLATTILSFAAILGLSALVFNYVFGFPGADPSVVLYAFIFLVALGIDYNIFLMTRVREESLRRGTRQGTLVGLVATGSVITSAGIVLAATFAALAVIPILFLAQLAFIVAFGVLFDTTVVRSLLVPALAHDIDNKVWWPSKKISSKHRSSLTK